MSNDGEVRLLVASVVPWQAIESGTHRVSYDWVEAHTNYKEDED